MSKLYAIKLSEDLYYSDGRAIVEDLITKLQLLGHHTVILPNTCSIQEINSAPEIPHDAQEEETKVTLFHVEVGDMPRAKAIEYMKTIKEEWTNIVGDTKVMFLPMRNGIGCRVETIRV